MIDCDHSLSLALSVLDPRLQGPNMQAIDWVVADPSHQKLQVHDVVGDAAFVLVFAHKLRGGLLEASNGPYSVDLRLPGLLHDPYERPFCFLEPRCTSALANSASEEALVDVPDSGSHDEAGYFLASHAVTPFRGRPLRALYSPTQ